MNEFDDLDTVFGPLRSDATPEELAGESSIVDAMARNHRTTKGSTMFSSRRSRVAAFVAAGILGFGGMAAAADPILNSEPPVEEPTELPVEEPVEEPTEPPVEEPTELPAELPVEEPAEEELVDPDKSTTFDENLCLEGNHGKTVSAAARGKDKAGALVLAELEDQAAVDAFFEYSQSEVAKSSCGKDYEGVVVEEDEEIGEIDESLEKEVEHDEDDDRDDEKKSSRADKPGKPDHAGKQGKGNKGKKG